MTIIATIAFLLFVLVGTFFLTAATSAFRRLRRNRSREELNELGEAFVFLRLQRLLFPDSQIEALLFALYSAQNITRFLTGVTAVVFLIELNVIPGPLSHSIIWLIGALGLSLFFGDFLPRTWSRHDPMKCVQDSAPLASTYLIATLPLTFIFLFGYHRAAKRKPKQSPGESIETVKEKIIEMIEGASTETHLDENDKKLIESAVTFRDRVVREVMVPRVEIFAISATSTVREAAKILDEEGYSRAPVYKNSVDNIVGILMYKDLMNLFMKDDKEVLDQSIEGLIKEALYTPETRRVSDLLQEFRKKQTHIAVVVDEYGGTEGIVTIEDLLEEIVGEIEDEYDEEEALYHSEVAGGWIIDARMTILDLEEELGVEIPQDGEYDTLGGFIFHRSGTIPQKGLVIHSDTFELEILSVTDRTVEKVRLTPISHPSSSS